MHDSACSCPGRFSRCKGAHPVQHQHGMADEGVRGLLSWLTRLGHVPSDGHEALALAVHGLLVQHGFRPAEVPAGGENEGQSSSGRLEEGNDTSASSAADSEQQAKRNTLPVLPGQWGSAGYGGRYRHHRSAMTFDVRAVAMGPRLIVHAAAVEDDERMHTLELRVDRYVHDGNATNWSALRQYEQTNPGQGSGDRMRPWEEIFENLRDLATLVQVNIAHRLVPDAAKDGYEATAEADVPGTSRSSGDNESGGVSSGRRPVPRYGGIEDDERDPLRIGGPMRPGMGPYGIPGVGGIGGGRSPFDLGHDDLLAPGLPRGFGGVGGGIGGGEMGGNLMGPRHPAFAGGGGGVGGVFGPRNGQGRRPPGVPPGARFDPYGPPVPTPDHDGGSRDRQPPPRQGFVGEPDNDIERPPPPDNEHELPGPPPDHMYW